MSYRIKSVATLTGVSATTLRAWERRYDLVSPERTESGYRVYSEDEIATLVRVKALLDNGYKVGEAIELVRRGGAALPPAGLSGESLADVRRALLAELLALDHAGAMHVHARLVAVPFDRQLDEVFLPLLRDVGALWEAGEVTVAQEHFCSSFARAKLAAIIETLAGGAPDGREVVCAGAPGELHEFGLMAVAIHLAVRGWRIIYLGLDVPTPDLAMLLHERRPAAVCSSLILRRPRRACLELASSLRAAAPRETAVIVGGRGLAPNLEAEAVDGVHLLPALRDLFSVPSLSPN